MARHATKIVATLGPASSDPALLEAMIRAGVNVVRLNFSHGKAQDHIDRARLVREAAARAGREVAIMADLQGPKIRVGKFAEGKVMLEPGAKFVLDASRTELGDLQGVGDLMLASAHKLAAAGADFLCRVRHEHLAAASGAIPCRTAGQRVVDLAADADAEGAFEARV